MKFFGLLLFISSTLWAVNAAPFLRDPLFAIPRGGGRAAAADVKDADEISVDDYERAERVIFDAVGMLEQKVQHAVENEVDTLFHDLEHHEKESIKETAKAKVRKSATKVRQRVQEHDHATQKTLPTLHEHHPFPFAWPAEDPGHRILHAVEAAEKAVLHAVEEEVNTIFHELKHHEDDNHVEEKAHKALETAVPKMDKHVEEKHEDRRQKVLGTGSVSEAGKLTLEDYLSFEMESLE